LPHAVFAGFFALNHKKNENIAVFPWKMIIFVRFLDKAKSVSGALNAL
jgi:hypothetical protein